MLEVVIRIADEADLSEILRFIGEHFETSEPTLVAYQFRDENQLLCSGVVDEDDDDDKLIKECIENGTTFVAHDLQNQLVGIAVAGRIVLNEHKETLKIASTSNDRKFADIMKFLAYIEEKADVCNRFHVPESLHLHIISVHKSHYGNGIAGKLFKEYFEQATKKGYFALSVDCTNYYTSKIAQRFNMKLLSTVSYDEYNEYVGEKIFIPKEPHTLVRSYGIKLRKNL